MAATVPQTAAKHSDMEYYSVLDLYNDFISPMLETTTITTNKKDMPKFPRVGAPKDYIDLNYTAIYNIDALGDIGIGIEGDFDMNFGYRMPWYNKGRYMITKFSPHFKFGGLTHVVFYLYFMRIHVWIDLIAA